MRVEHSAHVVVLPSIQSTYIAICPQFISTSSHVFVRPLQPCPSLQSQGPSLSQPHKYSINHAAAFVNFSILTKSKRPYNSMTKNTKYQLLHDALPDK